MHYHSIRKKTYIKSCLELQREITLIELASSPYASVTLRPTVGQLDFFQVNMVLVGRLEQ